MSKICETFTQLSHKKQPTAAHCGQSLGKFSDSGSVENVGSLPLDCSWQPQVTFFTFL